MKIILIEKYVNGTCMEKFRLPTTPLQYFFRLLPNNTKAKLRIHGIDIDVLLTCPNPKNTDHWITIQEGNITKHIRISHLKF